MIDLHIHTNFSSDGIYRPETLFKKAKSIGLKVISFTDHNEIKANFYGDKLSKKYDIKYIPGIEITSIFLNKEIHILGYFIDYKSRFINELVEKIKVEKIKQSEKICKNLNKLGFKINFEDLIKLSKGRPATGVTYLKTILKNKENLKDERLKPYLYGEKSRSPFFHFYNDWIKSGKPAYASSDEISADEAIFTIIKSLGLPVIAHPINLTEDEICNLKTIGICGIEVFTTYHDNEKRQFYKKISQKNGLFITAGSDFHGERIKKDVRLGMIGGNDFLIYENMLKYYENYYGKKPYSL